jgi:hypothetical protein
MVIHALHNQTLGHKPYCAVCYVDIIIALAERVSVCGLAVVTCRPALKPFKSTVHSVLGVLRPERGTDISSRAEVWNAVRLWYGHEAFATFNFYHVS